MRNVALTIQYEGTNYNGWQIQSRQNVPTIQGILQQAIQKITGESIKLIAAGRTDAGVHAIYQVASFLTYTNLKTDVIQSALNANLPYDIRILNVCDKDIKFNPRFDAKSKVYSYFISNSKIVSPFLYKYTWNLPYELDFEEMEASLKLLLGQHDFSSFRGSCCGAKSAIKTIFSVKIQKKQCIDFMSFCISGNFIKFSIEADSFLRHMVRNIVGTIVEIGRGRWKAEDISRILLARCRKTAGQTAPAKGLFLEKINY